MKLRSPLVLCVSLSSALLLAGAAAATTFTYSVVGGGLDDGHACLSSAGAGACASEAKFEIGPTDSFPITGSFSYDDVAGTIDIDITLATGSMGGSYDGVDSVEFTTVHYVVNDMPVLLATATQIFGQVKAGEVTGTYAQLNGVSTVVGPDAFGAIPTDFTAFSCSGLDGVGLCGLTVGASRDFDLNVGTTGSGDPLDFVHTFNFNVVIPEPATGSLLALGLATLAFVRRRH
jgi:hypothetical protein